MRHPVTIMAGLLVACGATPKEQTTGGWGRLANAASSRREERTLWAPRGMQRLKNIAAAATRATLRLENCYLLAPTRILGCDGESDLRCRSLRAGPFSRGARGENAHARSVYRSDRSDPRRLRCSYVRFSAAFDHDRHYASAGTTARRRPGKPPSSSDNHHPQSLSKITALRDRTKAPSG